MDILRGALILVQWASSIGLAGCVLVLVCLFSIKFVDAWDRWVDAREAQKKRDELRAMKEGEALASWYSDLYHGFDDTGDIIPQVYSLLREEENYKNVEKLRDDLQ